MRAPEQHESYDKPVDIWALGVVCFVLLAGVQPFALTLLDAEEAAKEFDLSFPDEDWAEISTTMKDLIWNCLQLEPGARSSAEQLVKHPWVRGATARDVPLAAPRSAPPERRAPQAKLRTRLQRALKRGDAAPPLCTAAAARCLPTWTAGRVSGGVSAWPHAHAAAACAAARAVVAGTAAAAWEAAWRAAVPTVPLQPSVTLHATHARYRGRLAAASHARAAAPGATPHTAHSPPQDGARKRLARRAG